MAITFGFYNSLNGDRKYNTDQFSQMFNGLIKDGIFASVGGALLVSASTTPSMTLLVAPGRAWFNSTWLNNDAVFPLTLDPSEIILKRYDAVVIEVNSSTRTNDIKIIKGTPASTPAYPVMANSLYLHQYPLCYILVESSITAIPQAKITNKVGTVDCPYITGIIDSIPLEGITAMLNSEFDIWFAGIQGQLDGDIAGNLANQITNLNETVGKMIEPSGLDVDAKFNKDVIILGKLNGVTDEILTSGIWKYKLRSNGEVEMWGRKTDTVAVSNPYTGGFYSTLLSVPMPFVLSDIFLATIDTYVHTQIGGSMRNGVGEYFAYYIMNGTSGTFTADSYFHVVGIL